MAAARWQWDLLGPDGELRAEPASPAHTNRFDAEAWLGEHWRALSASGVAAVLLRQQGRPVAPVLPLTTRATTRTEPPD